MDKSDRRTLDSAVDTITNALAAAMRDTIEQRDPEPARELVAEFAEFDLDQQGESIMAVVTIVLLHWLALAREELADRPDRVDESLAWVGENLGNRYRLRARCVSAPLVSADDEDQITGYMDGLGADFVPAIIWLLAGVVARYGEGAPEWLRALEAARLPERR